MTMLDSTSPAQELIDRIYRDEWGRVVAALIRLMNRPGLSSFDLAEEAAQEAFSIAVERWRLNGIPANPRAWLIATARNKAIDALRGQSRLTALQGSDDNAIEELLSPTSAEMKCINEEEPMVEDDRLRLIFTCCHPALVREAQVALTLRTLCGLTTEQIAEAFLVPLTTMAQRLVRAKQKIRDAGIPYRTPILSELAERLESVLLVVYLVFNEGYSNPARKSELCTEAIRLGRTLAELMPRDPEIRGLLALMLLQNARRDTRLNAAGDIVLLEDQDRTLWHRDEVDEGLALVDQALRLPPGPYTLQAAIAAVHMRAITAAATDWEQIIALYDVLLRQHPSPVIELNRAVAIALAHGCEEGLKILDELTACPDLRHYSFLPAARGALLLRTGQWALAAEAYRAALALTTGDSADPEYRFLQNKLAEAELRRVLRTRK